MEHSFKQEEQHLMIATYTFQGQLMKQYKGYTVPKVVGEWQELECGSVYCHTIKCEDCILFPTGKAVDILDEYNQIEGKKNV